MTNEQILEKAIAKAEKNGWDFEKWYKSIIVYISTEWKTEFNIILGEPQRCLKIETLLDTEYHKPLLTDHVFAKAFWGEENHMVSSLCRIHPIPKWQHHLQQMVITDNWLEYIEQFIKDSK